MFKVTVSGDYRTSGGVGGAIVDFENVVGVMPDCDERMINSHVQNRYLGQWIKADKRYTERFNSRRNCYIDKVEVVSGVPSCNGKDIKKLDWIELQDLAVSKNLLRIPLIHASDIRAAREIAYLEYSKKVLDREIDVKDEEYDFAKLPALIVAGEAPVAINEEKRNAEESLKDAETSDTDFSLSDLKKIAKKNNIKLSPNMTKGEIERVLFQSDALKKG